MADQRFTAAEQSARLAALQETIEHNALAITHETKRAALANDAARAVADGWQTLLADIGLQMLPPTFSAWCDRRRRAMEAATEQGDVQEGSTGRQDPTPARPGAPKDCPGER